MRVQIGEMRDRVEIQQRIRTTDALGGYASTWSTIASVWARVVAQSGGTTEEAGQEIAPVRFRVYIRYAKIPAPAPELRIEWRGRTFHVMSVQPDERRKYVIFDCSDDAPIQP